MREQVGEVVAAKPLKVRPWFGDSEPLALDHAEALTKGDVVQIAEADGHHRVAAVLARAGTPIAKMYAVAARHQLDPSFPDAVLAEVDAWLADPHIDDPDLEDLRALPFVSIDGPGTRDIDQALYVEAVENGWRVYYALADPSFYVRPGSALFAESLRRGASYYLPGLAVPMLPRPLSEGIVSLNGGVDRRALVFVIDLTAKGDTRRTRLTRARIRSRAQLDFAQVERFLDEGAPLPDPELADSMRAFAAVGELRLERARRRNIIQYRRSETEVKVDRQVMRFVIQLGPRTRVERYNEQLSLLCNTEGAQFLKGSDGPELQPIYRVHPRPSPERYDELVSLIDAIVTSHQLDPEVWRWNRANVSLADYLEALPHQGAEGRIAQAIHRQAVMTNFRSTFSQRPGRHHGVGATAYARFSAPMREVVGVFLHKETIDKLTREASDSARDEELRAQIVQKANDAKVLQKEITKAANRVVLDELLERDVSQPRAQRTRYVGTVMGLTPSKAHVSLDAPAIEVKLYARHLAQQLGGRIALSEDGSRFERDGESVCRIGDEVTLCVHGRDGGRWRFDLVND